MASGVLSGQLLFFPEMHTSLRLIPLPSLPGCSFLGMLLLYSSFQVLQILQGFPGGASGKEPTCQCGRHERQKGSVPGLGRSPGGGPGNPLQYSCLENPHGQRSLVGYSPSCHKESDRTEVT